VDCFDGIWLLICALSLLEYPLILPLRHHMSLDHYYTVVEGILILRNGLLILATIRAVLGKGRWWVAIPGLQPIRRRQEEAGKPAEVST
jgi:hypothetical protein